MESTQRHYFDYAAATPLDPAAAAAMRAVESLTGNPASLHAEGRARRAELDQARAAVAKVLAARAEEIIFTSGSTESDNLAIFGVLTAIHHAKAHVITVATEHAAVLQPMAVLRAQGLRVDTASLDATGRVDLPRLKALIGDDTVLVSIALATSEVGIIQPIAELGRLLQTVRAARTQRGLQRPILFHTDAAAAAGLQSLHVAKLGIDLLTLGSTKVYGPAGAGCLYVRYGTPLAPQLIGGNHERGRRAGTENIPAIVGFATALTKAAAQRKSEVIRLKALRAELWDLLRVLPGVSLNSPLQHSLVNTLNVSFAHRDGEDLVLALDARGFAVATGAACAESSQLPSHVLIALGCTPAEAQGSLRITLGRNTDVTAIHALVTVIRAII